MKFEIVETRRNCTLIDNGYYKMNASAVPATRWNTADCCLRTGVMRFPPYTEMVGGDLFYDFASPVHHVCGSLVEYIKILIQAVNCTCMRAVATKWDYEDYDFLLTPDYAHIPVDEALKQRRHYPIGFMATESIMGRENATASQGIRILSLFTPWVWLGYLCSVLTVAVVLSVLSHCVNGETHRVKYKPAYWSRVLPESVLNAFGINLGQPIRNRKLYHRKVGPNKPSACQLFVRYKFYIVTFWSVISLVILSKAATSDLLEILLHTVGTDRFTSVEDLFTRVKTQDRNLTVGVFALSRIAHLLEEGDIPENGFHHEILRNDENIADKIYSYMDLFGSSSVVMVGISATLTYIRSLYIKDFECLACNALYVQEDTAETVPYYIHTNRGWPPDKTKVWYRTTAVLLESGMSEYAYRRALAFRVPEVARKEVDAREERRQYLRAQTIRLKSIQSIVGFCGGFLLVGGFIVLWPEVKSPDDQQEEPLFTSTHHARALRKRLFK